MEGIYIIIAIFVILNSISDSISNPESFWNTKTNRGGLKRIPKRRTRETQDYFVPTPTIVYPKNKTSFIITLPPNHSSKWHHKIHISEFTNPKTGLNPFLDLLEGTSNNTSRNKNLTISKPAVIHIIPPPKPTAEKPREPIHEANFHIWNFRPADSKPQPTFIKPQPAKNEWPRMHFEPVEGDSGGRVGRPQLRERTSFKGTNHFQDVIIPQSSQREPKVSFREDGTKRQGLSPNVNQDNETTTVKSFTISSILLNSTINFTTPGNNLHEKKSINKAPITIKPKLHRIKNNHEQIYSIKTHQKLIIISIVSGITVVILIILLTMCFYKGRSKRFTGSRHIALENISTNNSSKKTADINYKLVREFQAVTDKKIIK